MALQGIITGRTSEPRRITIYGVGGIGKGTWAAGAPKPLFIQTEDGNNDIGVDRLPLCRTLGDVQSQLRSVFIEEHGYQTLVIDSLDQLEPLIWGVVAAAAGKDTVGEIGFGKGYDAAVVDWRKILFMLDKIRAERRMTVILIAHAKVERFEDPQNDAYDRYSLQLHRKAAAEITHWTDELLFANYVTHVRKLEDGRRERAIGIGGGQRVIHTQERPAFVAKSRVTIPPEIPMPLVGGWDVYAGYFDQEGAAAAPASPVAGTDAAGSEPASQAAPSTPSDDELAAAGFAPTNVDQMDFSELRDYANELRDMMEVGEKRTIKAAIDKLDSATIRMVIKRVLTRGDGPGARQMAE